MDQNREFEIQHPKALAPEHLSKYPVASAWLASTETLHCGPQLLPALSVSVQEQFKLQYYVKLSLKRTK